MWRGWPGVIKVWGRGRSTYVVNNVLAGAKQANLVQLSNREIAENGFEALEGTKVEIPGDRGV